VPEPSDRPVAIVTGGTRGIGRRLATVLAEDGFSVAVVGRDQARLDETTSEIDGSVGLRGDVSRPVDVHAIVAEVTALWGRVDVLVNNAGVRDERALPWEADVDDWWRTIEVNVRGVMLMTAAVLPGMIARGRGRVVDLGSGIGLRAEPRYSAYSVSKAAALRWIDNVAAALGPDSPIRVVSVSPGLVRTDMTETMWDAADDVAFGSTEPVERFVRRFAAGELDHLHGHFVHAVHDEF
jgi:NAD(P)-dependent dehydrogenase (short-subunit alcohol dehydrogenase family)